MTQEMLGTEELDLFGDGIIDIVKRWEKDEVNGFVSSMRSEINEDNEETLDFNPGDTIFSGMNMPHSMKWTRGMKDESVIIRATEGGGEEDGEEGLGQVEIEFKSDSESLTIRRSQKNAAEGSPPNKITDSFKFNEEGSILHLGRTVLESNHGASTMISIGAGERPIVKEYFRGPDDNWETKLEITPISQSDEFLVSINEPQSVSVTLDDEVEIQSERPSTVQLRLTSEKCGSLISKKRDQQGEMIDRIKEERQKQMSVAPKRVISNAEVDNDQDGLIGQIVDLLPDVEDSGWKKISKFVKEQFPERDDEQIAESDDEQSDLVETDKDVQLAVREFFSGFIGEETEYDIETGKFRPEIRFKVNLGGYELVLSVFKDGKKFRLKVVDRGKSIDMYNLGFSLDEPAEPAEPVYSIQEFTLNIDGSVGKQIIKGGKEVQSDTELDIKGDIEGIKSRLEEATKPKIEIEQQRLSEETTEANIISAGDITEAFDSVGSYLSSTASGKMESYTTENAFAPAVALLNLDSVISTLAEQGRSDGKANSLYRYLGLVERGGSFNVVLVNSIWKVSSNGEYYKDTVGQSWKLGLSVKDQSGTSMVLDGSFLPEGSNVYAAITGLMPESAGFQPDNFDDTHTIEGKAVDGRRVVRLSLGNGSSVLLVKTTQSEREDEKGLFAVIQGKKEWVPIAWNLKIPDNGGKFQNIVGSIENPPEGEFAKAMENLGISLEQQDDEKYSHIRYVDTLLREIMVSYGRADLRQKLLTAEGSSDT